MNMRGKGWYSSLLQALGPGCQCQCTMLFEVTAGITWKIMGSSESPPRLPRATAKPEVGGGWVV